MMLMQSRLLPARQACARRTGGVLRHPVPVRAFDAPRQSVDPMAAKPRPAAAAPGIVYPVYTPEEVDAILAEHKDRLVIVMCKSTHCKPCKAFMPKYQRMAEMLTDCVLLELTGDLSAETKKLMISWGVKSTPTFRMYRGGEVVGTTTGAREAKILPVLTELLLDTERGKHMKAEDLEESTEDDDE